MASRSTKVFLDRIEGDIGVLLTEDGDALSLDLPVRLFPDDIQEGTAITLTLTVDERATEAGRRRVADLMDELRKRDL